MHLLPGAPPHMIVDLERRLGITLPDEYRKFLTKFNGGKVGGLHLFSVEEPGSESVNSLERWINLYREEDFPIVPIAASEDFVFGYLKSDLDKSFAPIYVLFPDGMRLVKLDYGVLDLLTAAKAIEETRRTGSGKYRSWPEYLRWENPNIEKDWEDEFFWT